MTMLMRSQLKGRLQEIWLIVKIKSGSRSLAGKLGLAWDGTVWCEERKGKNEGESSAIYLSDELVHTL